MCRYIYISIHLELVYIMSDVWHYCNAGRRNVLATTLFFAVVRLNATRFLSNLTFTSFSAGLDFGWGRGCMSLWWMQGHVRLLAFLVVRLCCKRSFRGGPGGNPPPWKADEDITGPNSCTCTARPLVLATQRGTQVAHRYLSRPKCNIPQLLGRVGRDIYI